MRYRTLDASGDFTFGRGGQNYLIDSPALVAQAIQTALLLFQGEWFLDLTAGTPWLTQVLGEGTTALYDAAIKQRVLGVAGVSAIIDYSSSVNHRALNISMKVVTIFGMVTISPIQISTIPTGYGAGPYGQGPYGL